MSTWLFDYSLFIAKSFTALIPILLVILIIGSVRKKGKSADGKLMIKDLSKQYQKMKNQMQMAVMDEKTLKSFMNQQNKEKKANKKNKETDKKATCYLINFKGNLHAQEVDGLREEISAVLSVATEQDEVVVNLESPGGVVHGYGLAASQLMRIRNKHIPLTVVVDKVAASGGYMMACTANKIIAAPFAILGSIGVVAQIPNFNRLLKKNEIDIELQTAGQYKRTLTMLGENTDEGREKFKQELEETHLLFKEFVKSNRPSLDINEVATGEHWYGTQALELGLIDEINTSDDVILSRIDDVNILEVSFIKKSSVTDKLFRKTQMLIEPFFFRNSKTL